MTFEYHRLLALLLLEIITLLDFDKEEVDPIDALSHLVPVSRQVPDDLGLVRVLHLDRHRQNVDLLPGYRLQDWPFGTLK